MYGVATDTYIAVTIVALWYFLFDLFAAGTAVFHWDHRKMVKFVILEVFRFDGNYPCCGCLIQESDEKTEPSFARSTT